MAANSNCGRLPRKSGFLAATYRSHKQSGQAIVTLPDGIGGRRDILLGKYGTKDIVIEQARVLAEWEAAGRLSPRLRATSPLMISSWLTTATLKVNRSADSAKTKGESAQQLDGLVWMQLNVPPAQRASLGRVAASKSAGIDRMEKQAADASIAWGVEVSEKHARRGSCSLLSLLHRPEKIETVGEAWKPPSTPK